MYPYSDEHIANLVQPTKVHRDVYTDPGVFEMEMERIWARAWKEYMTEVAV